MITWRKSSYSGGGGSGGQECVELASLPHSIAIRDSKAPDAGHLAITPDTFERLVLHIKRGHLDG
jgi:hypothetical protein